MKKSLLIKTTLLLSSMLSFAANAATFASFPNGVDTDSSIDPLYIEGTGSGSGTVGAIYDLGLVGTTVDGANIYGQTTINGLSDIEISDDRSGVFQDPEGRSRLGFGINGLGDNPTIAFSVSFFSDASLTSALSLANLTVTISDIDSDNGDDFSEFVGINSAQLNGPTTELGSFLTEGSFASGGSTFTTATLGLNGDGSAQTETSFTDIGNAPTGLNTGIAADHSVTFGLADRSSFDFIIGIAGSEPLEAGNRGVNLNFGSVSPALVPEPSSALLVGLGLTIFGARRRR